MFSEFTIGQYLLDNPICRNNYMYSNKNVLFFHFAVRLFIYLLQKPFTSNHASQICAAKKTFLQLENLALITHLTPFSNIQSSSLSFIRKSIEFFYLITTIYPMTSVERKG